MWLVSTWMVMTTTFHLFYNYLMEKVGKSNIIISGDFNSHSTMWGSENTNSRDAMVEDFILHNNLQLLNTGEEYTFFTSRAKSIIDLTLASQHVSARISDWKVESEFSISDYRSISFTLESNSSKTRLRSYNLNHCNWNLFTSYLDNLNNDLVPSSFWSRKLLHNTTCRLDKNIKKALDLTAPVVWMNNNFSTNQLWWNDDLTDLRHVKDMKKDLDPILLHRL